jgi:hypothetical protein
MRGTEAFVPSELVDLRSEIARFPDLEIRDPKYKIGLWLRSLPGVI